MNCFNGERFIKNAIDSIYNQSIDDWQIIFWDNCSTDLTSKIANSYNSKLKYFRSNKTVDLGMARKFAINECNSEFICFLDYDDEYLPKKLELQLELMERNDFALCCGREMLINENGNRMFTPKLLINSGYNFDKLLLKYQIGFQSVMLRKSILDKEKMSFPSDFSFAPDYHLFMSIASKYRIGVINSFLVKHRIVKNSLTSQKLERVHIENKKTLDEIFTKNPELRTTYKKEADFAYNKIEFYRIVYLISINNLNEARKLISNIKFKDLRFSVLFLLLKLRVSKKLILKLLNR